MYIDHSVYPDTDHPPDELPSMEAKADYVHRIVAAGDFGVIPEPEKFALFSQWKDVFDAFPGETSLAYHAMRLGWDGKLSRCLPESTPEPRYRELDRLEERVDPCENMV